MDQVIDLGWVAVGGAGGLKGVGYHHALVGLDDVGVGKPLGHFFHFACIRGIDGSITGACPEEKHRWSEENGHKKERALVPTLDLTLR